MTQIILLWGDVVSPFAGIILCLGPANERRRYTEMLSLIGGAHTEIDPCSCCWVVSSCLMQG